MIDNKDLTRIMSTVLNKMGRFQVLLFFALVVNALIYGINHTLTAFHIYTPSFTCEESGNIPKSCQNISSGCPSGYKFNNDDYTITVEWELVCGKRYLAALTNTLYFVGVTFGALICGILSDSYGRKLVMLLCLFTQGIIGLLLQLSPNLIIFIILRIIQGFFVQGLQGACIALIFEYTAPRLRTTAIVAWHILFSTGALILAGMSFFVRNWKMLQNVITIPSIIIMCYEWAIPESIYWLYATNRKRHALKNCLLTAKYNKDQEMVDEITNKYGNEMKSKDDDKDSDLIVTEKAKVIDIWHSKCLRKHLLVLVLVNFSITVSYYGSVFFLNKLGGDRHVNFAVGSIAELIGFALLITLLLKIGTRLTIISYQFSTGFLLVTIGLIINFIPESNNDVKVQTIRVLCLIAKAIAMSSFATMILFNTELFPTICRGAAFGICGFAARAGSITAPFLMLLADYAPIIPMIILGILLVLSAILSVLMPDTRNVDLPHTIDQAESLWQKND